MQQRLAWGFTERHDKSKEKYYENNNKTKALMISLSSPLKPVNMFLAEYGYI